MEEISAELWHFHSIVPGYYFRKSTFFEEKEVSVIFPRCGERRFIRLHSIIWRKSSRLFNCCQDKKTFPNILLKSAGTNRNFGKVFFARMEEQRRWGLVGCFGVVKRFSECAEKQWKPTNSFFTWRANIFFPRFWSLSEKKYGVSRKIPERVAKNTCMKIKAEYYCPGDFFHEMNFSWSEKLKASSFWLRANTHGTVGGKKLSSTCVNFPIDQLDEKWNFRKNNKFLSIGTLTKTFELLTNKNPQELQNWILLSRAKYWETRIFVREKITFGNLEFFSKIVKTSFHRQEELFGDKYLSWRRKGFS